MSIASGSKGNSIYIGSDKTSLLVDVGISKKRIKDGLDKAGVDFKNIDGILITHEHSDHISSLGIVSRSYNIPIYATSETCDILKKKHELGDFDKELFRCIEPDSSFTIGDIKVEAHSVCHDGVDPVCYSFFQNNKKISIATDLGCYDDYLIEGLKDSDALLLEANHDIRMLQVGPYPYSTKQRILGKRGHLSNESSGKLLMSVLNSHIKAVLLGHLSAENNLPELAYETVKSELIDNPYTKDVRDFNLQVVGQTGCSELIYI